MINTETTQDFKAMVLLSIHPEHARKIISGEKIFEYRRIMPSKLVSHFALYCTAPVSKIVAVVGVEKIITNEIKSSVWMSTAPYTAGTGSRAGGKQ